MTSSPTSTTAKGIIKKSLPILITLIIAALTLTACQREDSASALSSDTAQEAIPVTAVRVKTISLPVYAEATGNTQAMELVEIRSRVDGHLLSRHFNDGDAVKKGQLLFQIDPEQYQQRLTRANTELEQARSKLELAKKERDRYAILKEKGAISTEEFEIHQMKKKEAEAELELKQVAANLAAIELGYCRIKSPIEGRVGFSKVEPGGLVAGGSTLLTKVSTVNPIHFIFHLSENDFLLFSARLQGQPDKALTDVQTILNLSGGVSYPHPGRIDMFDQEIDSKTGSIKARAIFPNPDGFLRPGMYGQLRITLEEQSEMLLIPQQAIISTLGKNSVLVVDEDNSLSTRIIEAGERYDSLRLVLAGLKPGELIVTENLQKLASGIMVSPTIIDYQQ